MKRVILAIIMVLAALTDRLQKAGVKKTALKKLAIKKASLKKMAIKKSGLKTKTKLKTR